MQRQHTSWIFRADECRLLESADEGRHTDAPRAWSPESCARGPRRSDLDTSTCRPWECPTTRRSLLPELPPSPFACNRAASCCVGDSAQILVKRRVCTVIQGPYSIDKPDGEREKELRASALLHHGQTTAFPLTTARNHVCQVTRLLLCVAQRSESREGISTMLVMGTDKTLSATERLQTTLACDADSSRETILASLAVASARASRAASLKSSRSRSSRSAASHRASPPLAVCSFLPRQA